MTNGPIEFLSDGDVHDVPATEFGGADGLIQPEQSLALKGDPDASGGHSLSEDIPTREAVSDRTAILRRAAQVPLNSREAWTGVSDSGEDVVDPLTGRELPGDGQARNATGERGELSDLKPA